MGVVQHFLQREMLGGNSPTFPIKLILNSTLDPFLKTLLTLKLTLTKHPITTLTHANMTVEIHFFLTGVTGIIRIELLHTKDVKTLVTLRKQPSEKIL